MDKIKELQEVFASLQKEYKKLTGYTDSQPAEPQSSDPTSLMYKMMDNIGARLNYVHDRIDQSNKDSYSAVASVHKKLDDHMGPNSGHIPPVLGLGKMKKVLKKLDIDGDYDLKPSKTIYASTMTSKGLEVDVEYVKPQK